MRTALALVISALFVNACGDGRAPDTEHPSLVEAIQKLPPDTNILFITFDALRADALGVYGNEKGLSPNIDRWAEQGFVFDQFYVAAQATPTSFAAGFTGQYPFRSFRQWNLVETQTMAKLMNKTGRTSFGIFHNVQLVDDRNFRQGFETYEVLNQGVEEHIIDRASTLLRDHSGEPFFGWVHFISPHAPYERREVASHLYGEDYEGPYSVTSGPRPFPDNDSDHQRVKELYEGEVYYLDQLFKSMLEQLETLGLDDNTIVILTADHGEEFGEHGDYGHDALYEEIVRVPLIMNIPGHEGESQRISDPHINTDLLPTLAHVVAADYVPIADGIDMLAPHDPTRPLLLTAMTNNENYSMAIIREGHKLIVDCPPPEFRELLFDLTEDSGEQSNRILDNPQLAGELFELMKDEAGGDPCEVIKGAVRGADIRDNLDEETIEKLKSLGYIQ
jgi:arylsulfatase